MKAWIPNGITLLNLFCGCAAVICILDLAFQLAAIFLLAAIFFDFIDGLVARLLGVSSAHGKELDSLADMVSFGVVPGMIYYVLLDLHRCNAGDGQQWSLFTACYTDVLQTVTTPGTGQDVPYQVSWRWLAAPGLLVTLFSALRLAKFNLDTRQSEDFIGLATPSSTLYATGLLLIVASDLRGWGQFVASPAVLYGSIVLMCGLLVSEIRMFSFKMKSFGWSGNQLRYIFAASAIGCLVFLGLAAFPFIVLIYVGLNAFSNLMNRNNGIT